MCCKFVTEGVGDLWPLIISSNTHAGCRLTRYRLLNVLLTITRSSADADNRLDAFSGQSRSTNMVPFHM